MGCVPGLTVSGAADTGASSVSLTDSVTGAAADASATASSAAGAAVAGAGASEAAVAAGVVAAVGAAASCLLQAPRLTRPEITSRTAASLFMDWSDYSRKRI